MPAAPSRKPVIPLAGTATSGSDEEASVRGRTLEEPEPVEPEPRVREHPRLRDGRIEDGLELVGGDRARRADPLDGPGHSLDEHLVGERAQVAVAEPDVAAHAVVARPVEGAAHGAEIISHVRSPDTRSRGPRARAGSRICSAAERGRLSDP